MLRNLVTFLLLTLFLHGCASKPKTDPETGEPVASAPERAVSQASEGFGDAATQPLEDLNLKRDKIPELLLEIKNPYHVDPDIDCAEITAEVTELDAILGRDFDVPPPDKKGLDERAADGASSAFLDAVASGASGFIPYRGFVRMVTGASAHEKKVLRAYDRGSHRRTYLKGLGQMKGCPSPASPLPEPEIDPRIVYK